MESDKQLISPCGYSCGSCPAHEDGCTDEVVIENMAKRANMSLAQFQGHRCPGCRPAEGKPRGGVVCPTYDCCANKKGLDFCYQCEDFPCLKLAPISQGAEVRTHNSKIYNLLLLKKLGIGAFIEQGEQLWIQYARGKTPLSGDDIQI